MLESSARALTNSADNRLSMQWWRAANYLTAAQLYLQANPLLREPLQPEHIKPRPLGHWGTAPGLNLVYAHLNALIRRTGQDVLFVAGPGHGGAAIVANLWLEGTYSEFYPEVTPDEAGLLKLMRQFSTPGGIPSHVGAGTPGSISEGGELGYSLAHAFGAAFDNPDLLVACVVGDGEAETAALEGSWKSTRFLNPARDGAVLPILHLNENKISGPTVLGRAPESEIEHLLRAHGYHPRFVEGDEIRAVHMHLDIVLDEVHREIAAIQRQARSGSATGRPLWPAIVLRTPKGWTGPHEVDGKLIEGTFRAHQVPIARVRENPAHLAQLERWLRSYRPEELFDEDGRVRETLAGEAPSGAKRMGMVAAANGGELTRDLVIRDLSAYSVTVAVRGRTAVENTEPLGRLTRDVLADNPNSFRLFCPDETKSNRLGAAFEVTDRCLMDAMPDDENVSPDGRVMEVLSEHLCEGWLEGYTLTGRHGLFATYEAFAMVSASMTIQHAKWLEEAEDVHWRAPVPSLNLLLTSTCWRNDHNGFSHQGPGLIDSMLAHRGSVVRVYLPADANTLLAVSDHCLRSRNYVNLVVADKQSHPQYLDLGEARNHAQAGASVWQWASTAGPDEEPDIVLVSIGDVPTQEALAAAALLREHLPDLRVRFVNVVDLMRLAPLDVHPHGLSAFAFHRLFGHSAHAIVAFHGYARALHQVLHGRAHPDRFHVRGYEERGTTTTPFDMTVLNRMSRYHLVQDVLARSKRRPPGGGDLLRHCGDMLQRHHGYIREHLEDMPEVRDWTWPGA
jgi:xylulose-5-phosphate/fructose-6-phosphate phosphoketolase